MGIIQAWRNWKTERSLKRSQSVKELKNAEKEVNEMKSTLDDYESQGDKDKNGRLIIDPQKMKHLKQEHRTVLRHLSQRGRINFERAKRIRHDSQRLFHQINDHVSRMMNKAVEEKRNIINMQVENIKDLIEFNEEEIDKLKKQTIDPVLDDIDTANNVDIRNKRGKLEKKKQQLKNTKKIKRRMQRVHTVGTSKMQANLQEEFDIEPGGSKSKFTSISEGMGYFANEALKRANELEQLKKEIDALSEKVENERNDVKEKMKRIRDTNIKNLRYQNERLKKQFKEQKWEDVPEIDFEWDPKVKEISDMVEALSQEYTKGLYLMAEILTGLSVESTKKPEIKKKIEKMENQISSRLSRIRKKVA